jgi:hypothetical protein
VQFYSGTVWATETAALSAASRAVVWLKEAITATGTPPRYRGREQ